MISLTLHHQTTIYAIELPSTATLADFSTAISNHPSLNVPPSHQKLLITPSIGLQVPPFRNPSLPASSLVNKKIVLLASTPQQVSDLESSLARARQPAPLSVVAANKTIAGGQKYAQDSSKYTFHEVRVLAHLPSPSLATSYLNRLRSDPAIVAAMIHFQFSVPILSELDPYTPQTSSATHSTLGLNRNAGQEIMLRLRTDAGDGFRHYPTVRKTLCHELAHIRYANHDRPFWDLCRRVEDVVARNDRSSGRTLDGGRVIAPPPLFKNENVSQRWTEGQFVLGGGDPTSSKEEKQSLINRRELLTKAVEARLGSSNSEGSHKGKEASSS